MGTKIVYNHKAIEKKWREKWEETPVNPRNGKDGNKKPKYYCLGYVSVSIRKWSSCRTLERICNL